MKVFGNSLSFDWKRLKRDLIALQLPTDFSIAILPEIKSYWGRYFSIDGRIKVYVGGLSYEKAFPHILHEVIHHFQYRDPTFKREIGVMHNKQFWVLYKSKLVEWSQYLRNRGDL